MEPFRLRRWRRASDVTRIPFFTCARPGRSKSQVQRISDEIVHQWVNKLPGPNTSIVSLLGRKPDGTSEFWFYSFYGGCDSLAEAGRRLSFQTWLDKWHADRGIQVVEHPTIDLSDVIPPETLAAIAADIDRLLAAGRTVILVDSGGTTRTGQVCRYMRFVEDSRSP